MSKHSESYPTPRLLELQQRISVITWLVTLLLSLRGLFDFYGMRDKGDFEQLLYYATEPIVALFNFPFLHSLEDIRGIVPLFAAVSLLIASKAFQTYLKFTYFRTVRTHELEALYIISSNKLKNIG